jgi:ClpP class serine protease
MLELLLDGRARRVEQLAQLRVAEQLAQLRLIDRERLRPPFRERRIAVVDVVGDIAEKQRRGERRRRARIERATRSARVDSLRSVSTSAGMSK